MQGAHDFIRKVYFSLAERFSIVCAPVAYSSEIFSLPHQANVFFMNHKQSWLMISNPIECFLRTIENLYPVHAVKIVGFSNQSVLNGLLYCFGFVVYLKLAINVLNVFAYGTTADKEIGRNLVVSKAAFQLLQQFNLTGS